MIFQRHGSRVIQRHHAFTSPLIRSFSSTTKHHITLVTQLANWDLKTFQEEAYKRNNPVKLPFSPNTLPPACTKWFIHDQNINHDLLQQPQSSELRTAFWSDHESSMVPLELTSSSSSNTTVAAAPQEETTFHRSHAPLKILLTYLSNPQTPSSSPLSQHPTNQSIYLAQCSIDTLPTSVQQDLPTPELVTHSGKGDIYSTSLWMGRPPTYTPLHRDPNPNLFIQLAGRKVIRLFPPEVGDAIFDDVQRALMASSSKGGGGSSSSASFRGEEMMAGPEREVLHRLVWGEENEPAGSGLLVYAMEADLGMGEGLFIPKGWWHSVKGVGEGVTASANWWFR